MGIIRKAFDYLFDFLLDGIQFALTFLWKLFDAFVKNIGFLLNPILEFARFYFYFLYKVGVLLWEVVKVVLYVGKLLVGLVTGLFKTLTGLSSYSGGTVTLPQSYQTPFHYIHKGLEISQVNKLVAVFTFIVWLLVAWGALKIVKGMKGGAAE